MFEQIRDSFAQMQPGDKMVMHLHKAQMKPQYQTPGAPGAAGDGGAMGAQPSAIGGARTAGSMASGMANPANPYGQDPGPTTAPIQAPVSPESPNIPGFQPDPMQGQMDPSMPSPLSRRDALIGAMSRMRGV